MTKRSSFEALIWSGYDWNNHARQVVCVALCIVFARWRRFQSQTKCRNNSTCQLVRRSFCLLIQQKHSPALLSSNLEVLLWRALKIDDNAWIDNVLNDDDIKPPLGESGPYRWWIRFNISGQLLPRHPVESRLFCSNIWREVFSYRPCMSPPFIRFWQRIFFSMAYGTMTWISSEQIQPTHRKQEGTFLEGPTAIPSGAVAQSKPAPVN